MSNQVNFVYDIDPNENSDELKHFLFLESVRLSEERQEIADEKRRFELEKKKLERERELFDKQWKIVEQELRKIGNDRANIAKDKAYIEKEKANLRRLQQQVRQGNSNVTVVTSATFFAGVTGTAGLKKRYKELLKIYHPDNGGDAATLHAINREYEKVRRQFGTSI
ncbi:MAG: molecular chaperone DnaJ [Lachnospiraceae bacterium]|nr:molecular chaperone DnaJ [Lachnospiraceae bacterium]